MADRDPNVRARTQVERTAAVALQRHEDGRGGTSTMYVTSESRAVVAVAAAEPLIRADERRKVIAETEAEAKRRFYEKHRRASWASQSDQARACWRGRAFASLLAPEGEEKSADFSASPSPSSEPARADITEVLTDLADEACADQSVDLAPFVRRIEALYAAHEEGSAHG